MAESGIVLQNRAPFYRSTHSRFTESAVAPICTKPPCFAFCFVQRRQFSVLPAPPYFPLSQRAFVCNPYIFAASFIKRYLSCTAFLYFCLRPIFLFCPAQPCFPFHSGALSVRRLAAPLRPLFIERLGLLPSLFCLVLFCPAPPYFPFHNGPLSATLIFSLYLL